MNQPKFNNNKSPFQKALKLKVNQYFDDNQISSTGNWTLYSKSIAYVLSLIVLYTVLVFFTPAPLLSVTLCALMGITLACLGFNVMHEGGHSSYSDISWLNGAASYFLNVMGGSSYIWKIKHNINHHTYTNVEGHDDDIELQPFMRLHHNQKRYWFHRFQHIYCFFLYGFTYVNWVLVQDFVKYFTGKIVPGTTPKKFSVQEHFIFWITKIGFIGVYIVLPILMVGLIDTIIGFSVVVFVCGMFIAIVFQLAHTVKDAGFESITEESDKIDVEWSIHQINTTANFGTKSRMLTSLIGGLNFQVEHHLFPKISHVHYKKISALVKETCDQFNVRYIVYPTMLSALAAHLHHVRTLGRKDS